MRRHKPSLHSVRDGAWPGLDFKGKTLAEIRDRIRGVDMAVGNPEDGTSPGTRKSQQNADTENIHDE